MSKITQKIKSGARKPDQATQPPLPSRRGTDRVSRENSRLVGLSILGVVLSVVVAFPPLSPVLCTAPVIRPLIRRVRAGDRAAVTGAFWRWALTVFLTALVSAAFVRDRMVSSFPFGEHTTRALEQAVAGAGTTPAMGLVEIVVGMAAFLVLSAVSLGTAGCVLMSVALGTASAAAAVLFTHGNNVLLIALIACPPWLWALFAAATLAFAPVLAIGGSKWFGVGASLMDRDWLKRRAVIAGGLFLLAVLLRLFLVAPYLALVRLWTVS